jgi:phage/conjugal plasmid C-4 type zinc finger TraR family protein
VDEIDAANERVEHLTKAAIQTALDSRSRVPSSGICQTCGETIEPERLRANPYASDCRDCAAEEEAERQRLRRTGSRR